MKFLFCLLPILIFYQADQSPLYLRIKQDLGNTLGIITVKLILNEITALKQGKHLKNLGQGFVVDSLWAEK